jgi:hypothetical protein
LLKFRLQALEQRESVGSCASKPADNLAFAKAAHFFGIGFDNSLADRNLAVAADHHAAALADGENGRAVPGGKLFR